MADNNAINVNTTTPLVSSKGGTGVNNGSSVLTLGGNLTTSGAFASTFTMTGATNVTFPTSGTLATTAGAGFTQVVQQTFTGSGTYTPTANMKYCVIECIGGGGAGGSAVNNATNMANSAGGGSGSYSRKVSTAAAIGASQTVTIGAGGTPGAAGNNPGGNGGDTSVGSICIGKGGSGGAGSAATANTYNAPGLGGVAGTGDFTPTGNPGGVGLNGTTAYAGASAYGGNSVYGGGGRAQNYGNTPGVAGTNYGAGGSGCVSFNVNQQGGAGSAGVVIITEYI